jgi:Zn-dependent M16 (insulinase) family peptidase
MMRKLEYFEQELGASPTGRAILGHVRGHMDEVSQLVNTNRTVMVAWQRNNGPRFLVSAMDSGFDENTPVQKEIEGVTLQRLLLRMADALQQSGSRELAATIGRFAAPVLNAANECGSLADLFRRIRTGNLAGRSP